jgi:NAD(P)-dependent dehydrogenase (short-subunit alcohol dehydrogenase family)
VQGIGLAISHQIAQAGGHVAIIYKSSPDAPERAKEISEKYGVHCEAYKCDVSDQAAVAELVGKVYKDVGPVGGVVCNAGESALLSRGDQD